MDINVVTSNSKHVSILLQERKLHPAMLKQFDIRYRQDELCPCVPELDEDETYMVGVLNQHVQVAQPGQVLKLVLDKRAANVDPKMRFMFQLLPGHLLTFRNTSTIILPNLAPLLDMTARGIGVVQEGTPLFVVSLLLDRFKLNDVDAAHV